MPPVQLATEVSSAFTILNHEDEKREKSLLPLPRNVNVVKPLQHGEHNQLEEQELTQTTAPSAVPIPAAPQPPAPNTILDPKFSRALDFKLRRLKDKEILQANLQRPTRYKPRNGALAASNPCISGRSPGAPAGAMSQSHPRIDIAGEENAADQAERSPAGRRGRSRQAREGDKPRFVTTVKAGQFLLPPPEIACLLGLETLYPPQDREKIVFSYASKPKAVAPRAKRSPRNKESTGVSNGAPVAASRPRAATEGGSTPRRPAPGEIFSGVRALVASVVGLQHLLDKPHNGSMATGQYNNVMHDKRVVRGSTFAAHPHAAGDGLESAAARAARTRRRAMARRAAAARLRPGTPPPAPGRRHHPIQTEYYLEELFDKGEEHTVGVQTDLFAERPATPVYVPAKTGADAHTQIYPGDLFDFDLEVQPVLEVLVGKTAEQALAEVAQEEELGALREQQRRYCELRDAERAERARLAQQHRRLDEEKERRVAEAREAQDAAREARERTAAAALVQGYVAELLPAVLAGLRDQGYLVERIRRGVDEEFMPWLVAEVSQEIESIITSRDVITEIVRDVVEARAELYRGAGERDAALSSVADSITPPSELAGEGETTLALDE